MIFNMTVIKKTYTDREKQRVEAESDQMKTAAHKKI